MGQMRRRKQRSRAAKEMKKLNTQSAVHILGGYCALHVVNVVHPFCGQAFSGTQATKQQ